MKKRIKAWQVFAALAATVFACSAFANGQDAAQGEAPHRVTLIVQNHTPPGTEIPILALSDALSSQLAGRGFQVVNPYNAVGVNQNRDIRGEATPEASAIELAKTLGAEGAVTATVIELSDSPSGGRVPTLHQFSIRVTLNLTDAFTGAVICGETIKRTTKKYTNNNVAQNKTNILNDLLYATAEECATLLKDKAEKANWKPGCDRFGEPFATEKYVDEAIAAVAGELAETAASLEGRLVASTSSLEGKLVASTSSLEGKLAASTSSLEGKLADTNNSLESKISAKTAALEGKFAESDAAKAREIELLKKIAMTDVANIETLSSKSNALADEDAKLAGEIAALKADLGAKAAEIASLKEELSSLKSDFAALKEQYLADLRAREAEAARKAAEEAARKGVLSLEELDAAVQRMMASMRQDENFRQNYDKAAKDLNHLPMAIVGVIKDETNGGCGNQDLPNFLAAGRVGVRVSLYKSGLFEVKDDEERVNLANRIIDGGNSPLEDAELMAALKSHGSPDFYCLGDLRYFPAEKCYMLRLAFHNLWTGKIVWEDTADMQ